MEAACSPAKRKLKPWIEHGTFALQVRCSATKLFQVVRSRTPVRTAFHRDSSIPGVYIFIAKTLDVVAARGGERAGGRRRVRARCSDGGGALTVTHEAME